MFSRFGSYLIVTLALVLVGCSGGETRVTQGNAEGVLHFANGAEPQTLDPHVSTGKPESYIQDALLEGLISLNPFTLEPEPEMAERWEISEDGRRYRFHIRDEAKWSNGDPLTAEDFRWSWWRALQPALGNLYVYMLYAVENAEAYATGEIDDFEEVGVKVVDDNILEVTLAEPTPYFLQLLNHHATYPVHRQTLEALGSPTSRFSPWDRPGTMITNGAFELDEWIINRRLVVKKSDSYWDKNEIDLEGIVFYPTENVSTEERMFRSGQLHRTSVLPLDKVPVYRDAADPAFQSERYLGSYFYRFNTTREPFDDARVRKAMAMAVDRKLLLDTLTFGTDEPSYAITPPGTLGYQPPKLFDFDPESARTLLAEAGYPNGEGFPEVKLLFNTNESHRKFAVAIQQMWKQHLNIDVALVNQEWKVYLDTVTQKDYDIARAGWIGDYVDPNTFLDMWVTDGGNNRTGWSSEEYDRIVLRETPKIPDQTERFESFYRAETILMEAMPILPIYTYSTKRLVSSNVKGMTPNILDIYNYKYISLEH